MIKVKTTTRIEDKCIYCGYGIYVENVPMRTAIDMFESHGWTSDKYNRLICPECKDEKSQGKAVKGK